jgi:hypothetical protein
MAGGIPFDGVQMGDAYTNTYPKGIKVSEEQRAALALHRSGAIAI